MCARAETKGVESGAPAEASRDGAGELVSLSGSGYRGVYHFGSRQPVAQARRAAVADSPGPRRNPPARDTVAADQGNLVPLVYGGFGKRLGRLERYTH